MDEKTLEQIEKSMLARSERGTSKERGTGLGILIVKEFMEKHRGSIAIESKIGFGTDLYLIFKK
jgi:signal transduction histidine kinase